MNILLHSLLLCQSCRGLRNVTFGGRILGLIKSAYHGWLSMMTSSDAPFLVLLPAPPTLNPPLAGTYLIHSPLRGTGYCHNVSKLFWRIDEFPVFERIKLMSFSLTHGGGQH